ncbi:MAG: nucleotidyltransferase family protein, partial [Bacilli bacterium]
LGGAYIRAILNTNRAIQPVSIARLHNRYDDDTLPQERTRFASATSIRKAIASAEFESIRPYVPNETFEALTHWHDTFGALADWSLYFPYLRYRMLTQSKLQSEESYLVKEGIQFRMHRAAQQTTTFETYMQAIKTKRYPFNRLQRTSLHMLTGYSEEQHATLCQKQPPIRLLGANAIGRMHLKQIRETVSVYHKTRDWYAAFPFYEQLEWVYRLPFLEQQDAYLRHTALPIMI